MACVQDDCVNYPGSANKEGSNYPGSTVCNSLLTMDQWIK